jgi:1-acyl-sn-glycerol-3-phosphate acyltransferase
MGLFRRFIKILGVIFACVKTFIVAIFTVRGYSPKARQKAALVTCQWAQRICKIINLKVHVHGNIPNLETGTLVVSNHLGYTDILVCGSIFKLAFAPKIEMRSWPFIGWLTSLNRPVWIDRKNQLSTATALNEMANVLQCKVNLIVYPEGTTTDGLNGLLPFKSTAFAAAVQCHCPIQPILITYSCLPKDGGPVAWFGNEGLLHHIWRLLNLKEIHAQVYIMPIVTPNDNQSRKDLACQVYTLMENQYSKVSKND